MTESFIVVSIRGGSWYPESRTKHPSWKHACKARDKMQKTSDRQLYIVDESRIKRYKNLLSKSSMKFLE
jgi:hypothetical protein